MKDLMQNRLLLLVLAMVALSGLSACGSTIVVEHPKVDLSAHLPAPEGFAYDRTYEARSEKIVGYYNYAYLRDGAVELKDAETTIRRDLGAAGWEFISQDLTRWEEDRQWVSNWRRKKADGWDRLTTTFVVKRNPENTSKYQSQFIYRMNTRR